MGRPVERDAPFFIYGDDVLEKVEIILRHTKNNIISERILVSSTKAALFSTNSDRLIFPGLEIMIHQQEIYRDGNLVSLTKREFFTLVFLAQHPNWILTAQQIYEEVWENASGNCGGAVATIIGQLRRKLTPNTPKDGYIQTVFGRGYKFVIPS